MKKTIKISELTDICNRMLQYSMKGQEFRQGIQAVLETVLSRTDQYAGFEHLRQHEVATKACKPGVNTYEDGTLLPYDLRFVNTDPTRVRYFNKG